jgi:hypothetical protein
MSWGAFTSKGYIKEANNVMWAYFLQCNVMVRLSRNYGCTATMTDCDYGLINEMKCNAGCLCKCEGLRLCQNVIINC